MKIRCLRTCIGVYQLPVVYGPQPTVNVENVNIRQTTAQPPPGDYKGTGVLRLTHFPRLPGSTHPNVQNKNFA